LCGNGYCGRAELGLPQLPAHPAAGVVPRRLRRQPAPRCASQGTHGVLTGYSRVPSRLRRQPAPRCAVRWCQDLSRASVPARTDRRLWCGTNGRAAPVSKAETRKRTSETERTKPERPGVLAAAEGGGTFGPTAAPTYAPKPRRSVRLDTHRSVYVSLRIGLPVSMWLHFHANTLAHKHTHTHTRARNDTHTTRSTLSLGTPAPLAGLRYVGR
jgi:hypothetical protein